jgi:hypothetical protein
MPVLVLSIEQMKEDGEFADGCISSRLSCSIALHKRSVKLE